MEDRLLHVVELGTGPGEVGLEEGARARLRRRQRPERGIDLAREVTDDLCRLFRDTRSCTRTTSEQTIRLCRT